MGIKTFDFRIDFKLKKKYIPPEWYHVYVRFQNKTCIQCINDSQFAA